ncbi:LVIVD repeat-containing protein [Catalinimonas niigatensis]|uniref:LVIVD repeat-containing protein n=1 Tax=Catalinimonas niigatensis TaxID=1397264 RepID=UPI0026654372|nr:hypothetical protein [Catalinimonas niigatensis]WPP50789.1 hypothetical protein PZB72_00075 [Catalinimonas niigatensis]
METMTIEHHHQRKLLSYLTFNVSAIIYLLLLIQCTDKVEVTRTYKYMKPVYMTTSELRSAVDILPPRTIQEAGKIYFLNNYLFLNDPGEGIHIIDNSDPSDPNRIAFINIPGNFDLAAKGNYLYADSFIDLMVFDISDVNNIREVRRVENVFPLYTSYSGFQVEDGQIITEWVQEEITEVIEGEMDPLSSGMFYYRGGLAFANDASFTNFARESSGMNTSTGQQNGAGGSMARFAVVNNYLYTIDDYNMQVFDISQEDNPEEVGQDINVGFMIETIFPYEDKLFIGAQNGMHIYDNTDPANPQHVSTYEHITSCDPVVVEGNTAYVTLRNGNECQGFVNQLEVIDIEDPYNPQLVETYAMEHPHGLGIDNGTLFICEGEFGLKVFDASDSKAISENQLAHFDDIHAYDVIPLGGVLMLIGNDGLYQYDYTDPANIQLLSKIAVPSL